MRILIACVALFLLPPAVLIGIKQYQAFTAPPIHPELQLTSKGEVLFFNASWCGPCRQMRPIVAQMKREGYRMRDIDVDQNRALAQKYRVSGIPTFVFVENGAEVRRFSGGTSPEKLRSLCDGPLYH